MSKKANCRWNIANSWVGLGVGEAGQEVISTVDICWPMLPPLQGWGGICSLDTPNNHVCGVHVFGKIPVFPFWSPWNSAFVIYKTLIWYQKLLVLSCLQDLKSGTCKQVLEFSRKAVFVYMLLGVYWKCNFCRTGKTSIQVLQEWNTNSCINEKFRCVDFVLPSKTWVFIQNTYDILLPRKWEASVLCLLVFIDVANVTLNVTLLQLSWKTQGLNLHQKHWLIKALPCWFYGTLSQDKLRRTTICWAEKQVVLCWETELAELMAPNWFYPYHTTTAWTHLYALCIPFL